jgi:hypothetical protein
VYRAGRKPWFDARADGADAAARAGNDLSPRERQNLTVWIYT